MIIWLKYRCCHYAQSKAKNRKKNFLSRAEKSVCYQNIAQNHVMQFVQFFYFSEG